MSRLIFIGFIVAALFWLFLRWRQKRASVPAHDVAPTPVTAALPPTRELFAATNREGPSVLARGRGPSGRRTILVAGAFAVLSLFLPWGDVLLYEKSGFSLGAGGLLLAWTYPLAAAYWSWRVVPSVAKGFALMSLLAGLMTMAKASHTKVLFFTLDAAGVGIYVYLAVSTVFVIGVFRYADAHPFKLKRQA